MQCETVRNNIIFNTNNKLPDKVDSSLQFSWYKINKFNDITFDYFENYDNSNIIEFNNLIDYYHGHQYRDYSKLKYTDIYPFVEKYFSPSHEIRNIMTDLEKKYNINYNNICVLFYRGNDKITETPLCGYDEYVEKAKVIFNENPHIKFLIQSDETEFIEKMLSTFPDNSFYFKDEIRHMNKCNDTVDRRMKDNIFIFKILSFYYYYNI